jgi:hypothetical protein
MDWLTDNRPAFAGDFVADLRANTFDSLFDNLRRRLY